MIKNEKGFTFPLVLIFIILISLFLTFQLQFFLSEKRLHHESITILKQEYYMHSSLKRIESSLQNNMLPIGSGQYVFQSGFANYRVESYSLNMLKVTINIKLHTLEENVGIAYYDKNQVKMIKWIEKN
jgi:hypothetical protein